LGEKCCFAGVVEAEEEDGEFCEEVSELEREVDKRGTKE
jgi:hypothetical protein